MAGRGRGRGGRTIAAEIGIEKDDMPTVVLNPPPLFPQLLNKPLPFPKDLDRILQIKRQLKLDFKKSVFYIKPPLVKTVIEKYSDITCEEAKSNLQDKIDPSRFPKELLVKKKRKKNTKIKSPKKTKIVKDNINIKEKFEELEKKENDVNNVNKEEADDEEDDDEEKEKEDDENELDEEEYDEEIEEEETDYISSYFDNGEGYLDEEDDNMDDGPIY